MKLSFDYFTAVAKYGYSQSSVHMRPSAMSMRPSGHAQEILGERELI